MSNQADKSNRVAALQKVTLEPITDPAELAQVEQQRQRYLKRGSVPIRTRGGPLAETTTSDVLDVLQKLAAEDRMALLVRLVEELPPQEQRGLTERLLGVLLPEDLAALFQHMQKQQ